MGDSSQYSVKVMASIQSFNATEWNLLTDGTPLLNHAFLSALENSKSIGSNTGWTPYPIAVYDQNGKLVGAMPLYLKTHSYGEYVFDWAWADAYDRNGMSYYPKLISAIPFSPITSKRLLSHQNQVSILMIETLTALLNKHHLSSAHVLFPSEECSQLLTEAGWLKRIGVQFRWRNDHYSDFDGFLMTLSHNKRKKIKQERKKITDTQIQCHWITGECIAEHDWDFFYQCYCQTYFEHHSTPYLTRAFFSEIGQSMPENILLIIAEVDGQRIAATLNLYNQHTLYGRYWGALKYVPNLHFELCYYQAQLFCIENKIEYFEGGAQGEHKLARGFEPRPTCSYHKIAHPDFEDAIRLFVNQEADNIASYTNELEERAPFKK
jgi:uncharacterized protein